MKKRFVRLQRVNAQLHLVENVMFVIKNSSLVCVGLSLVFLAGCASKPPLPKAESAIVGQVPADPSKNPAITAEALKADSKSIAVTDIYFKKEGKNLAFIEESRTITGNLLRLRPRQLK